MKSEQLLTQGKIFEDDILAGPECTNHPAEEVAEPYDHAQNLTGTLPIELAAKSLILRVYDVLMNDTSNDWSASSLKHQNSRYPPPPKDRFRKKLNGSGIAKARRNRVCAGCTFHPSETPCGLSL